jgi:hypothetical protein
MSNKKNKKPIPGETPLFDLTVGDKEYMSSQFTPWNEYSDAYKVSLVTSQEQGPSVKITERDYALLATIQSLGKVSMLSGLQHANETPRRAEIQDRYQNDYNNLVSNTAGALMREEIDARTEFRQAFGYQQLAKAIGSQATAELFVEDYDVFQDKYYGPKGNKARTKFRKKLQKNIEKHEDLEYVQRGVKKRHAREDS